MWPWHWHNNPVECSYLFWSVSLTCLMCLFFFVSIRSCHVICSTAHGGWTKFVCSGLWIILRELTVYFKLEIHFTWFKTIRYVKSYTICISYSFCIVINLLLFFVLFFWVECYFCFYFNFIFLRFDASRWKRGIKGIGHDLW